MRWLKDVMVDLAVTVLIVLAVTQQWSWARWIVLVYTPFMLFMKAGLFFGGGLMRQIKRKQANLVPGWFFHVVYGINVVVLLAAGWWLTAVQWVLIWALSIGIEMRTRPSTKTA